MSSLTDLVAKQGAGWSASNPVPKLDNQGLPIPGVYTVSLTGPNGAQRIATVYAPPGLGPTDPMQISPGEADFQEMSVEETIKPSTQTQAETDARVAEAQAAAVSAKALADKYAADLAQTEKDNANRTQNQQLNGYWVTDKELADITARGNEQKLTQQQINNQLKIASDNNQVSRESNAVSAQNAATNAFVAQKNAEAQAAQVQAVITGQGLDQAKFVREQADRDIANRIAEDKLKLEQLQQRQANQIATGQLGTSQEANRIRGQELEQRTAEAAQTAETQALGQASQAAASTLGTERTFQANAAQTGGNLLQNRAQTFQNLSQAPFTQAANLSQGSAGRYGMLGGGLHSVPEGAVANIMQGAMGVSTGLYGGPNALQAAAQAIEQIRPGAAMTPMGQAAAAILSQIQERAGAILKGGQVKSPATVGAAAATPAATPAAAVAAPVTAPAPNAGMGIQPQLGMSPTAGATQALGDPYGRMNAITAPTTQPTININL
jgi:hypothetical protein